MQTVDMVLGTHWRECFTSTTEGITLIKIWLMIEKQSRGLNENILIFSLLLSCSQPIYQKLVIKRRNCFISIVRNKKNKTSSVSGAKRGGNVAWHSLHIAELEVTSRHREGKIRLVLHPSPCSLCLHSSSLPPLVGPVLPPYAIRVCVSCIQLPTTIDVINLKWPVLWLWHEQIIITPLHYSLEQG